MLKKIMFILKVLAIILIGLIAGFVITIFQPSIITGKFNPFLINYHRQLKHDSESNPNNKEVRDFADKYMKALKNNDLETLKSFSSSQALSAINSKTEPKYCFNSLLGAKKDFSINMMVPTSDPDTFWISFKSINPYYSSYYEAITITKINGKFKIILLPCSDEYYYENQ